MQDKIGEPGLGSCDYWVANSG